MVISRSIVQPLRHDLTPHEMWQGSDYGLIACWERGRKLSQENPELSQAAQRSELVPLPWKGGVAGPIKSRRKFGSIRYLAMWQGLKGSDLEIDLDRESSIECSKHGIVVTFTADTSKLVVD